MPSCIKPKRERRREQNRLDTHLRRAPSPPHPQPPIIHDINQTHQILLRQPTRLTHILMTRVRDTHPQPEQIPPLPPTLVPLICQKGTRPVGRITDEAQDAVGRLLSRGGVEDEEFAERGSVGEHGGGGRAEG